MNIDTIIKTSVEDARSACLHASREQLIAAHRWCEANPAGQKTRKEVIAAALRRQQRTLVKGGKP